MQFLSACIICLPYHEFTYQPGIHLLLEPPRRRVSRAVQCRLVSVRFVGSIFRSLVQFHSSFQRCSWTNDKYGIELFIFSQFFIDNVNLFPPTSNHNKCWKILFLCFISYYHQNNQQWRGEKTRGDGERFFPKHFCARLWSTGDSDALL